MEALPSVEAWAATRLTALGIDADSYANYVAGVLADASQPAVERAATLQEMLVLTVEDRDISGDVAAMLAEGFAFQTAEEGRLRKRWDRYSSARDDSRKKKSNLARRLAAAAAGAL